MKIRFALFLISAVLAVAVFAGCSAGAPSTKGVPQASGSSDPGVKANLAKLSPEDRTLAESQKTCPITGEPLGSMGVPPKVMLKDQPVFLCCTSCKKKAEADPDKTLKAVADAKAK
jgi:hypothetical protein